MLAKKFTKVEQYIAHFWAGLLENLRELLSHVIVVDIIGVCDFVLYKVSLPGTAELWLQTATVITMLHKPSGTNQADDSCSMLIHERLDVL